MLKTGGFPMRFRPVERWIARQNPGILGQSLWAVALITLPVAIRLALAPWVESPFWFPSYYPAVLVAGLLLGAPGGTAVWLLGGLAGLFLIVLPLAQYQITRQIVIVTAFYYFCSGLILLVAIACRAALIRLEAAHERDQQMKAELRHRIRNSIAVVQGLAHQTARRSEGDLARFREGFDGQLAALGSALGLLAEQNWQVCGLPDLPRAVLLPFSSSRQIRLEGPRCHLTGEAAEPLALILHELATNAVKYGALSTPDGCVHVRWEVSLSARSGPICEMIWRETGGPAVHHPPQQGQGSRLFRKQRGIRAISRSFDPQGLTCAMSLDAVPRMHTRQVRGWDRGWTIVRKAVRQRKERKVPGPV